MCKMIIVTNVKWPFKIIQGHLDSGRLFWAQRKAVERVNNTARLCWLRYGQSDNATTSNLSLQRVNASPLKVST